MAQAINGDSLKRCKVTNFSALLGNQKEIILLAALDKQVFSVEKIGYCDCGVGICGFLFVDREASLLCHFAHFAFGGDSGCFVGEKLEEV